MGAGHDQEPAVRRLADRADDLGFLAAHDIRRFTQPILSEAWNDMNIGIIGMIDQRVRDRLEACRNRQVGASIQPCREPIMPERITGRPGRRQAPMMVSRVSAKAPFFDMQDALIRIDGGEDPAVLRPPDRRDRNSCPNRRRSAPVFPGWTGWGRAWRAWMSDGLSSKLRCHDRGLPLLSPRPKQRRSG